MQYWRVKLPPGVKGPFEVYVNGVPQELGADYRIAGGELVFERGLASEKLGLWAWSAEFSAGHPDPRPKRNFRPPASLNRSCSARPLGGPTGAAA